MVYYSNLITLYGLPYQAAEPSVLTNTIPTGVHSPCPPCPYLNDLVINRPGIGYFPEQGKSWYICKEEDEEVTKQAFVDRGLTWGVRF